MGLVEHRLEVITDAEWDILDNTVHILIWRK